VTFALSETLAIRVRTLLRAADHPTGAAGTAAAWRQARDQWLDTLDPRETLELGEASIRSLIDFLSEAGPSRSSRLSAGEWSRRIDELIPELLFVGQS
jgi:hypothetical protein